jgi:tetratricopeptide (TPR) repeat protein
MLTSSFSNHGQPLVAAAMQTCLLSDRPNEALLVFDNLADGELQAAGEWQWAGGQDRLDPLCRDLAMQALGGTESSGLSTRALALFQQAEADAVVVSVGALHGVVCACENDGNWEDAVALLYSVLNRPNAFRSLVIGNKLEISDLESSPQLSLEVLQEFGLVLNAVMRTCNAAGQFGVALLCLRLVELALPSSVTAPYQDLAAGHGKIEVSLVPVLCAMGNIDDCVATAMISLCGVECPSEATSVFKASSVFVESDILTVNRNMFRSREVYEFALSEASRRKHIVLQETWPTAWRHIHRLTASFCIIEETGELLAPDQAGLLSAALATTLRCCTTASQAEAGLHLAKWAEGRSNGQNSTPGMFGASLPLTDSLVAAVMEAYCATGNYDVALDLFDSQSIPERLESQWMLSYNAALTALFSLERREDGIALFRKALAINRNPDMFCIAAKGFVESKQGDAVPDLYRLALTSGCLSEELSKFALVSVASGRPRDRTRGLRSIIEETAKITGSDPDTWIESKYWSLKKLLGFSTLRTLMWWHDPKTAHLDELELALSGFQKRAALGLTPKNDALRLIVAAASFAHEGYVPPDRTRLPRVPRDRDSWIDTIARLLFEAKDTTLLDDPSFIDDVAVALHRLDCDVECVGVVSNALERGVRLHRRALEEALEAAKIAEMEDLVEDIRMLVTDTTSSEQHQ